MFELELVGIAHWCNSFADDLHVGFSDNDASRYALIKTNTNGNATQAIIAYRLEIETRLNTSLWFARVPTEANLSDYPSRLCAHPLLAEDLEQTAVVTELFNRVLDFIRVYLAA